MDIKPLDTRELNRRTGHPSQLYGVRRVALLEGGGKGTGVFEAETAAGLSFDALPDAGMDIGRLRYKGVNLSYISKNGYDSPARILPFEMEFLHTFPAGMLFTCGLRNAGPPSRDGDEYHPQHGRYHSIPAEYVSARIEGDEAVLRGTVRESALFGPCLQLERVIRAPLYGSEISIEDTVVNLTPAPEEIMLLYHFNFGYPMLSEDARLIFPENRATKARTDFAREGLDRVCGFDPPSDGEEERVYFHEFRESGALLKTPAVKLENEKLGIGAELSWDSDTLPLLIHWRSMASGDYALGLEPSNSYIMGRAAERENGTLRTLGAFEQRVFKTRLRFYDIR